MKKLCVTMALIFVLLLLCACTPQEEPPIGGDPLSRDEAPTEFAVRTDVTLENVRYNELGTGDFTITAVNHTDDTVVFSKMAYFVQKKTNGQWTYVPFVNAQWSSINGLRFPVGESEMYFDSPISFKHFPGEFRLLIGLPGDIHVAENGEGGQELAFGEFAELIVGYITVTDAPQLGALSIKDGLLQSDLITMTDVYYADGCVYYTLNNQSDFRPWVDSYPWVQKKINGEWQTCGLCRYPEVNREYGVSLPIRGSVACSFPIDEELGELAGEYRVYFGQQQGGNAVNLLQRFAAEQFYIVGYLTIA